MLLPKQISRYLLLVGDLIVFTCANLIIYNTIREKIAGDKNRIRLDLETDKWEDSRETFLSKTSESSRPTSEKSPHHTS